MGLLASSGAAREHADAELVLDDRSVRDEHEVSRRRVRRLDLRGLQRVDHQRGDLRRADGLGRLRVERLGHRRRDRPAVQVGAIALDVYNSKIVPINRTCRRPTRASSPFEMCGNDGLQARSNFAGQSWNVQLRVLDTALANCTNYPAAGDAVHQPNANAGVKLKVVANLYYPGYAADNALSGCNDPARAENQQADQVPALHRAHELAGVQLRHTYGFKCTDSFANYMAADYDSNGDGLVDSDAIQYVQGESETHTSTGSRPRIARPCATPTATSPTRPRATTTSSRTTRIRRTTVARSSPASSAGSTDPARRISRRAST
jgi:hypothetical protein